MQLSKIDMEIMKERKRNINAEKVESIKDKKVLCCGWCKEDVKSQGYDFYYICEQHKTVFCENCAKNFEQKAINKRDSPNCNKAFFLADFSTRMNLNYNPKFKECIYKRFVNYYGED